MRRVATLTVDATFPKINTGAIVNDLADSWAGTWADFDNDGYLDLFVRQQRVLSLRSDRL